MDKHQDQGELCEEDIVAPIGRIVAVTGASAVILLDSHQDREQQGILFKSPEIGTLIKMDTVSSIALGLISALTTPAPTSNGKGDEMRIVEVEFIGELPKDPQGNPLGFRRGISYYPSLGDLVWRANQEELTTAYACDETTAIRVGHIQQDYSIPAMVKIDELLGKHFAVLGTTGTGKSCSVALILRRILEKMPQAHILLLDVHREYASSFREYGEIVQPDTLNLPFWLLNFEEICEILVGSHLNREVDTEVLRELIPQAKQRYMGNTKRTAASSLRPRETGEVSVGVDTPVPYRASDLMALLDEYLGKLDLKYDLAPYKRLKARLDTITRDPRYQFMFGGLTIQDTMVQIVSRLFRIPVNNKPITILELGGLPSEVINVVVSVIARMAFDFGLWSGGKVPVTLVCEEAHRYVPNDKTLGFEPTKRAISRIAKEGRKYGVSLCIVTQRPAELDPTILSQCSTIFSMRLTNERDQQIFKAGISDAAASLLSFMPIMGTGEAITFGEGVSLPTRIKFDVLPNEVLPKSMTASFTKNWVHDVLEEGFLEDIVQRWRTQTAVPRDPSPLDLPHVVEKFPGNVGALAQKSQSFASVPPETQASSDRISSPTGALARAAIPQQRQAHPTLRPSIRSEPSLAALLRQFKGS